MMVKLKYEVNAKVVDWNPSRPSRIGSSSVDICFEVWLWLIVSGLHFKYTKTVLKYSITLIRVCKLVQCISF